MMMRRGYRFLLAGILAAAGILPCSSAETPLKEGQNFYQARTALLRHGWQPVVISHKDFEHMDPSGSGDPDFHWIYAQPFWRHGFREIELCSGTETSPCGFNYRKKGRCLYLGTDGEYGMPGSPTVSNWWTYPVPPNGNCT